MPLIETGQDRKRRELKQQIAKAKEKSASFIKLKKMYNPKTDMKTKKKK